MHACMHLPLMLFALVDTCALEDFFLVGEGREGREGSKESVMSHTPMHVGTPQRT